MASIEIPLRFEIRPRDPEGLARAQQVYLEEMREAVGDCVLHVQERVKAIILDREDRFGDLINTGHLINSIATAVGINGPVVEGSVGTNVDYARYVEFGTVPHFVPFHMAKSLYDEAVGDWGWIKVTPTVSKRLSATPNKAVREGPVGMFTITGKRQTYLTRHPERLWLKPHPDAKPVWGVFVSGRKRPFMYPGWEQSLEFIEARLIEGCRRAAERLNQGG